MKNSREASKVKLSRTVTKPIIGGALLIDKKQIGIYIIDNHLKDNYFWKELIKLFAVIGQTFEIHCWNEETFEIAMALQLGKQKFTDWEYGVIIEGVIDDNFIDTLCHIEKPLNNEISNKMIPFFSIFWKMGFPLSIMVQKFTYYQSLETRLNYIYCLNKCESMH